MQSPEELGYRLDRYARAWIGERLRFTRSLARDVASKPTLQRVHDIRVACRRLREALAFFSEQAPLPPSERSSLERSAKKLAQSVRELRALDVAVKVLRGDQIPPDLRPAAGRLSHRLRDERRSMALRTMPEVVRSAERFLRKAKGSWIGVSPLVTHESLPQAEAEAELRAFIEIRVEARRQRVGGLCLQLFVEAEAEGVGEDARQRPLHDGAYRAKLHEIRVAIKHWRYANEFSRALLPRPLYRENAELLRRLQDLGGKAQDWADIAELVAARWHRSPRSQGKSQAVMSKTDAELLAAIETCRDQAADVFARELRSLALPR